MCFPNDKTIQIYSYWLHVSVVYRRKWRFVLLSTEQKMTISASSYIYAMYQTSLNARTPFYLHGLTLTPAWISNRMPSKVWEEMTDPFPNSNGCNAEVWDWINNSIPDIIMKVIAYSCCALTNVRDYTTLVATHSINLNFAVIIHAV